MNIWKCYNGAIIPTTAPNDSEHLMSVDKSIFKLINRRALLVRWTTDFDCECKTAWWYVIKDTPFDISSLKAKRRYEIKKGIKNFDVRLISPCDYEDELYNVQKAAFSSYSQYFGPALNKTNFINNVEKCKNSVFGAFYRDTNKLVGYAYLTKVNDDFYEFKVLKSDPSYEKYGVNAALIETILRYYNDFLLRGGIICDGARSISHDTNFQEYLEKYFGFRKAYCRLHILYNPSIKWAVNMLYPIRDILAKFNRNKIVHRIVSVLKMEEILRDDNSDRNES